MSAKIANAKGKSYIRRRKLKAEIINAVYPVTRAKIYNGGCVELVREAVQTIKNKREVDHNRGVITKMSNDSISRLILTAQATEVRFNSMITLTYPEMYPSSGTIVKNDVRVFTQWIRRYYKTEWLWFLEFQKRGAPHVHVLVEQAELSPRMRANVGFKWAERIAQARWFLQKFYERDYKDYAIQVNRVLAVACHEKTWELIKSPNGARNYVTKYAAKAYQKQVPEEFRDVGRFWGVSKEARPEHKHEIDVTDDEVREYLAERGHTASEWEVLPKILFNIKQGGQDD